MSISVLRRQVKNVALNYTDAQVKVREATSNDPWGPTTALMSEIADMTHNPMQFTEIMTMIWKRLNDHGKNWRHVYKSMVLLDYLIKCGSERVAAQCKENIFSIETLKDFQHIEDNRDQGLNVRTKAKQMVTLLADEEKLKNERARFMLTRKRFMQNNSSSGGGTSSSLDGRRMAGGSRQRTIDSGPFDVEFEEARPSSLGEEEMQLQIALALSKEECEKEQELRRGDDIRLQIAIEESKREAQAARSSSLGGGSPTNGLLSAAEKPGTSKSQGALDLLSLGLDEMFTNQAAAAGTSSSAAQQAAFGGMTDDPWSPRPSTTIPAMNTPHIAPPPQNDPWAAPPTVPSNAPANGGATSNNKELEAIFAMSSSSEPPPPANDPWAAFDAQQPAKGQMSSSSIVGGGGGQSSESTATKIGGERGAVMKTPESFLGENSALVNLDNLLGPTNGSNGAQPNKKAATNPFLIGSSSAGVFSGTSAAASATTTANRNNPFAANERPSPSLHEMMQAKQQQGTGMGGTGNGTSNAAASHDGPFGAPNGAGGSLI